MLACGVALTAGTLPCGSRIVRTIGRRIFRLAPVRCVCQSGSFDRRHPCVLLRRAPVSTTQVEKVYRRAKSPLIADADLREVAAKRELYRRLARTSDDLREVAERVWYSVLKQR
jgi:hypothetical protein